MSWGCSVPYDIVPHDGEFDVVDDSGETIGTHPTRKQALDQQRALYAQVDDATKEQAAPLVTPTPTDDATESFITRAINAIKALKEGRRNSTPDESRLQSIHDLAVANGAQCTPFVFKEASGRLRWVMLSSNSFQDTDREIVSQAALERDVDRSDKERNYGPLRWWHVGNPDKVTRSPGQGVDIGACDFRAMQGRVLVESGTFVNERIGEAIKQRADTLAGSIGFFHPLMQPDSEGVFTEIHTFERSLLPRGRASNQLTALTVTKENQDMATMKEKFDEFVALLGGDSTLAETVVKQAEQTEKEATAAGLKFKEIKIEIDTTAPAVVVEAVKEVEAEAAHEVAEDTTDYGKIADKIFPLIEEKMRDMISESRKEHTEKEAGLASQINALDTSVKEARQVIAQLSGDLPRGVKRGFIASEADITIDANKPTMETNKETTSPIGQVFNWLIQPVQGQG